MPFEFRPSLFDGVEVRGVGRQIEQLGSCRFDPLADTLYLVSTQVIHHHHLAGTQRRTQHVVQIGEEDLAIGRRFHGHAS